MNMSPRPQPIIGPAGDVEDFHVAAGFSGHGFMIAPITGQIVADSCGA